MVAFRRLFRFLVGELPRCDRKSTRLNSSHMSISYAVFCLKKKKTIHSSLASPLAPASPPPRPSPRPQRPPTSFPPLPPSPSHGPCPPDPPAGHPRSPRSRP